MVKPIMQDCNRALELQVQPLPMNTHRLYYKPQGKFSCAAPSRPLISATTIPAVRIVLITPQYLACAGIYSGVYPIPDTAIQQRDRMRSSARMNEARNGSTELRNFHSAKELQCYEGSRVTDKICESILWWTYIP